MKPMKLKDKFWIKEIEIKAIYLSSLENTIKSFVDVCFQNEIQKKLIEKTTNCVFEYQVITIPKNRDCDIKKQLWKLWRSFDRMPLKKSKLDT